MNAKIILLPRVLALSGGVRLFNVLFDSQSEASSLDCVADLGSGHNGGVATTTGGLRLALRVLDVDQPQAEVGPMDVTRLRQSKEENL